MKKYIKDNNKMQIVLDCKSQILIHWAEKSHCLKTYIDKNTNERYIILHKEKYYL